MNKTYVIVGGVAGGAGTAARLRRLDEDANIIMFEKGPYVSFANCGLPYYAGGVIKDREKLFVTEEETFTGPFKTELRTNTEVVSFDSEKKEVVAINHLTGKEEKLNYDALVLSTGSKAFVPPIKGVKNDKILTVRNVEDIDKVVLAMDGAEKAVVVGGGFVGIEMAENLKEKGLDVSLVEAASQVMLNLDPDMASSVHRTLHDNGIHLHINKPLKGFKEIDGKLEVQLPEEVIDDVDFVILSIGVRPETEFAGKCGVKLGKRGHIVVDERFQTNLKDIYAIGDATEYKGVAIALAGPANKQARLVADAIVTGKCRTYPGTKGTCIAKIFDLNTGSVGLNEKALESMKIDYKVAVTHATDHAGYYPGSLPVSIKVLYEAKTGKILGGQAVGYRSIDKKIDVISALMGMGGTIFDMAEFEQSYAPPFNSSKDLINMLGFIAENDLDGLAQTVDYRQTEKMLSDGALLIDVRSDDEYQLGTIEGAMHLIHGEIRDHLDEIPKDKDIILMCSMGLRGYIASRILVQHGFSRVYNLTGGYKTWHSMILDRELLKMKEEKVIKMDKQNKDESKLLETAKLVVDACGLQCPGPIVKLKNEIDNLKDGELLRISATDPGFSRDVVSWCKLTGNKLISSTREKGVSEALIEKGTKDLNNSMTVNKNGASLIVFSNDFDKALASLVLANGAAASGKKVTMFFTFWGLSILRKKPDHKVKKDFMGKMFGSMLPKNMNDLKLSHMNFSGMGPKMMKSRMKKKNVDQLEVMFNTAKENGVRFVACQMSMDIMGITAEELIDGAEIGGVATYMDAASDCDVNLFV